ncbi:hypothetical protein FGO68_gene16968 [Halteria grandinella]|uniref:Uncharacterized protein n=1 Tax=Halteria grandinella TaxID=5974 RepID=A0A8J8NZZ5_HALGN|nr:hypothetical protein FGO68_gene16968 [Halteria grandinella]
MFRRKWREDKGLCSLFDKRSLYRKAAVGRKAEIKSILSAPKTAPESPKLGARQKQFMRPQTQGGATHLQQAELQVKFNSIVEKFKDQQNHQNMYQDSQKQLDQSNRFGNSSTSLILHPSKKSPQISPKFKGQPSPTMIENSIITNRQLFHSRKGSMSHENTQLINNTITTRLDQPTFLDQQRIELLSKSSKALLLGKEGVVSTPPQGVTTAYVRQSWQQQRGNAYQQQLSGSFGKRDHQQRTSGGYFGGTNQQPQFGSDHSTDGDKCVLNSSIYQRVFQPDPNVLVSIGDTPLSRKEEGGDVTPTILGIKTNKSFHMKYAMNQQELNRRKRLQDQGADCGDFTPENTLTLSGNGLYRLADPNAEPLSPQELAYTIVMSQPFNRSGYITKLKIKQQHNSQVINSIAQLRQQQKQKQADSESLVLNSNQSPKHRHPNFSSSQKRKNSLTKGQGTGGLGVSQKIMMQKARYEGGTPTAAADSIVAPGQRKVVNIKLKQNHMRNSQMSNHGKDSTFVRGGGGQYNGNDDLLVRDFETERIQ